MARRALTSLAAGPIERLEHFDGTDPQHPGRHRVFMPRLPPGALPSLADMALLDAIMRDPKAGRAALAASTGLSADETRTRLGHLYGNRVVLGVRAVVKGAGGHDGTLQAYCQIHLDSRAASAAERFSARVRETAEIIACDAVASDFDFLLRLVVRRIAEVRSLVATLPHVRRFSLVTVVESIPTSS